MEDKQETSASFNAAKVISVDAALAPPLSELTQTFHVENVFIFLLYSRVTLARLLSHMSRFKIVQ